MTLPPPTDHWIELADRPGVPVAARVILWNPQVFLWDDRCPAPVRHTDPPSRVRTILFLPPHDTSEAYATWNRLVSAPRTQGRVCVELVNGDVLVGALKMCDTTHIILDTDFLRDSVFIPRIRVQSVQW